MLVMQTYISASHYSGRSLFHHLIAVDINTLWLVSNAISFQNNFDAGTWTLTGKGNCSQMSPAPQLHVHCAGNQKLDAGLDAIFRFCQENDSRFELFDNVALPFWLCAQASPWWLCQSGEIWRPQSQRKACREKSISLKYHVLLLWKVRLIKTHLHFCVLSSVIQRRRIVWKKMFVADTLMQHDIIFMLTLESMNYTCKYVKVFYFCGVAPHSFLFPHLLNTVCAVL